MWTRGRLDITWLVTSDEVQEDVDERGRLDITWLVTRCRKMWTRGGGWLSYLAGDEVQEDVDEGEAGLELLGLDCVGVLPAGHGVQGPQHLHQYHN